MNVSGDLGLIAGLFVAFVSSMLLSASETALLRISDVRAHTLEEEHGPRGRRLAGLLSNLPNVLNAVLLAALLSQIAAATLTGILAERWFGSIAVTVASIVLTALLFIYGEAIPKTYAVRHADRAGLLLSAPIMWLEIVLRPIVSSLVWLADLQMPGKGVATAPTVTEAELRRLAMHAANEGEITDDDVDLIERAFRLGDRHVDDIMVPRTDIIGAAESMSVTEALAVGLESGHRRLPVYGDSEDDIDGYVRIRDLLLVPEDRRDTVGVASLTKTTLVVPTSKGVLSLLEEMRETGIHVAIVVDEFGGTDGLVTIEDIAEELLGSLTGSTGPIVQTGPDRWSIDATLPVEDLAELIGVTVMTEEVNTVAGLVMELEGRIPDTGTEVDLDGHTIRVTGTRRRRITRVEVRRRPPDSDQVDDLR